MNEEQPSSSTESITTTNMVDLFVFPDFNLQDVSTWLEDFELWIQIQKMADFEKIYCALMKKLPKEFFKLVAPKIDHAASGLDKFEFS